MLVSTNAGRWHEHDPLEIISSVEACIEGAVKAFENAGYSARSIKAVEITNQRETTVVWDNETGEPLYNVSQPSEALALQIRILLCRMSAGEHLTAVFRLLFSTHANHLAGHRLD